jgi:hypothetical protein
MPGHDSKDQTVGQVEMGTGELGTRVMEQDSWDRTGGTGQPEQDKQRRQSE